MNDDFLHQHRQEPRESFGTALYQQLMDADETMRPAPELPTPKPSRRWLQWVAAALIMVSVGIVALQSQNHTAGRGLVQIDTRPPLSDLQPITAENAAQLSQIAQIGRGRADSVAYSPDGTTIAVGTSSGIALYNADLQTAPRLLRATHDSYRRPVAYSPDGQQIATIDGAAVRIWDVVTGAQHALLGVNPDAELNTLQFSPDGRWLAAGGTLEISQSLSLYTWDMATDKVVGQFEARQTAPCVALAFSPDGKALAVQVQSGTGLYDIALTNRQTLETTTNSQDNGLAYSPDGKLIAVSRMNNVLILASTSHYLLQTIVINKTQSNALLNLSFSPDGSLLAVVDGEYGIHLWDVKAGNFLIPPTVANFWKEFSNLAFSPDSSKYAIIENGNTLVVHDAHSDVTLASRTDYDGEAVGLALNADNLTVATYGFDELIRLHNLQTGVLIKNIPSGMKYLSHLEFSADGQYLAYSGFDPSLANSSGDGIGQGITLIDWHTGVQAAHFGNPGEQFPTFAFTQDQRLIADPPSGQFTWWNINQPEQRNLLFQQYVPQPQEFHLSQNSQLLAEFGTGQTPVVHVFDTASAKEITIPSLDSYSAYTTALSPDGTTFALIMLGVNDAPELLTFDITHQAQLIDYTFPAGEYVSSLAFSPDGKLLAALGQNVMNIFNPANPRPLYQNPGYGTDSFRLFFSSDGHFIVSSSWDGYIRVWGVPSDATPGS